MQNEYDFITCLTGVPPVMPRQEDMPSAKHDQEKGSSKMNKTEYKKHRSGLSRSVKERNT